MLKRKKNIGLNEQRRIDELFIRHDWDIKKIGCSKKNYLKHLLGEMTFMLSMTP